MNRTRAALVLISLVLSCVSCIPFNGPGDLKRDVMRSTGVKLDQIMAVTVGRTGMAIARLVTDGDEVPLKGVRKVEVGVYQVKNRDGDRGRLELSGLEGWQSVVRVREGNEDVLMMIREQDEQIRAMVVVVAEDEEVVLVRVKGRLDRVIEQAMEMALDKVDKPELFEPAVAEYRKNAESSAG